MAGTLRVIARAMSKTSSGSFLRAEGSLCSLRPWLEDDNDMTISSESRSQDTSQPALSRTAARMLARAREEWERRDFAAAEHSLSNVLALAPNDLSATRMLGMAVQRLGDHARAIDCFRRVLAAHPGDSDIHVCLGIALHERGETADAVKHLRHACELAPRSASAWFN